MGRVRVEATLTGVLKGHFILFTAQSVYDAFKRLNTYILLVSWYIFRKEKEKKNLLGFVGYKPVIRVIN